MYDYGVRFYDPQIGRWHSVDPLADFTPSINPYHYCYNNPIRFTDPTGMWAEDNPQYIASTYVDPNGKVLFHIDDGDPFVYEVTDEEAWIKGGRKKDGLSTVGFEDPKKEYKRGDQYTPYSPDEDPDYSGMQSKNADEYWEAHIRYYNDLGYYDEEGNPLYDLYGNPVAGYYPDGPMSFMSALALANVRYAPEWFIAKAEFTLWGEAVVGASAILYASWIYYDSFAHVKKKQSTGKNNNGSHDKQYTQGGKNRPKNPNEKKGAKERRNKGRTYD